MGFICVLGGMEQVLYSGHGTPEREESDQFQADSAHPAPIQGGDRGRAQGETAGEATKKADTPQK